MLLTVRSKFQWENLIRCLKKDNPSGIGSSKAFEVPQKTTPQSRVPMSEAADTHMDIVTILEDVDSHPQNDVDLGAA